MTQENPYGLPAELAKPVARGLLDHGSAILALAVAAIDRERLTPYPAPATFRGLKHLYQLHLEQERMRRAIADMRARWAEKRHGS
jgi:hypothetical protein